MRLVGYNDLQARSAYQPTIAKQGDRYILYVGHHGGTDTVPQPVNPITGQPEYNGTSIIDVTDPSKPKYLKHLPGQAGNYEQGGGQMVRICDGKVVPKGDRNAVYMLRIWRTGTRNLRRRRSCQSETDHPPGRAARTRTRAIWECDTGIAYLVSGVDGWRVHAHDRGL